ncbi:E3 ubiquitin-protein ligase XIAP-like [Lingula anatina]|uniref:E3 ubiquitin-protein ligase XIAP-like n=1 Tax=Lingula anatina TaxID=7574 RepID=A0A1S3I051_LINAN|nr:E3 ubiquitin-protein ligase XIAP-like [Lingula anatina]|eukprot:XP_013391201.1 E3 ubiquitin-protein ligase XIAP-like [Lingula anatina]
MFNPAEICISVFPLHLQEYFLRKANGPPFRRGEEFRYEAVRLSTFRDMPNSVPVPATRLARAGFYYSGEGDEVICFSCGRCLREWTHGENPAVRHRNVSSDCPLMNGTDTENVPIFRTDDLVSNDNIGANVDPFPNLANARSTPLGHGDNIPSLLSSQQQLSRSLGISLREVTSPQITPLDRSTMTLAGVASGVRSIENKSAPTAPSNTSRLPTPVPSQMRNESDRLATFVNWPSGASVRPRDLARAGFFYVGTEDRVQCAFCEGVLRDWEPGYQPMQEHRIYLSTCPFVLGLEVGNIPLEEPSTALSIAVSEPHSQAVGDSTTGLENAITAATLGILTERPRHERYAIESTRVQSFANWPPSYTLRPEELARAGFFYAGFGDNVNCFFCNGWLRNWEPQDDPWAEHARWFPRCGFVRQCKGDKFIRMIKEGNSPHNLSQAQTQTQQGVSGSYHVEPREFKASLETPTVQAVLNMGFSPDTVRQVIEKRLRNVGDDFPSAASLLDAVFNMD